LSSLRQLWQENIYKNMTGTWLCTYKYNNGTDDISY